MDPGIYHETDALITNRKGIYLVISFADCLPIFFFEPEKRIVASIHAGWKGIASGIIKNTVEIFSGNYDVDPETIIAAVGPSIGPCCYVIKEDVAGNFADEPGTV